MNFDAEGHIVITPRQLFQLAIDNPTRLVVHYLIKGTPPRLSLLCGLR
jgi:hypothetical protein